VNVDAELASEVASGLGMREVPAAMPKALTTATVPEVTVSPALSLLARPGDGSIRARKIAILVADGCDAEPLSTLSARLTDQGAVPRFVAPRLGAVAPASGEPLDADISLEAAPAVLYDAVVLPGGDEAIRRLNADGRALEFIKDQYRHCKPILALGDSQQLLEACGVPTALPDDEPDPGVILESATGPAVNRFIEAVGRHRHFARESDPPRV
jgi:catalase